MSDPKAPYFHPDRPLRRQGLSLTISEDLPASDGLEIATDSDQGEELGTTRAADDVQERRAKASDPIGAITDSFGGRGTDPLEAAASVVYASPRCLFRYCPDPDRCRERVDGCANPARKDDFNALDRR